MATRSSKKKKRVARKPAARAKGKAVSSQAKSKRDEEKVASKASANKAKTSKKKTSKKKASRKTMRAASKKKTSRKATRRRVPARKKAAIKKATGSGQTIHCTLAPTGSTSIVLPTSTIAEITDYSPPAPLDGTPDWLLGQVEWEDWQVPVISYGSLLDGENPETATGRSRIMVVKSLSNTARVPYIGVLVEQIPKLAKLSEEDLEVTSEDEDSPSVHCAVKVSGHAAVVPDLERLAQLVGHAAYGTAEKGTQAAEA